MEWKQGTGRDNGQLAAGWRCITDGWQVSARTWQTELNHQLQNTLAAASMHAHQNYPGSRTLGSRS